MRRIASLVVAAVLLTGCGGSSGGQADTSDEPQADVSVCIKALDEANYGFRELGRAVSQVQQAFDVGMSGDPQRASAMLNDVNLPSSDRYKELEAECRAAAD